MHGTAICPPSSTTRSCHPPSISAHRGLFRHSPAHPPPSPHRRCLHPDAGGACDLQLICKADRAFFCSHARGLARGWREGLAAQFLVATKSPALPASPLSSPLHSPDISSQTFREPRGRCLATRTVATPHTPYPHTAWQILTASPYFPSNNAGGCSPFRDHRCQPVGAKL